MEIDHSIVVAHGWCKTTHSRSHMNRNEKKTTQTKHRQKQLKFTPTQCFNLCASFLPVSLSLSLSIYFVGSHLLFFCIIALQAFSSNLPCIRWLIWGWLRLFVSVALVFLFGYLWIWSNQFVYWICAFKCERISTGSSVFHWKIIARNGPWLDHSRKLYRTTVQKIKYFLLEFWWMSEHDLPQSKTH